MTYWTVPRVWPGETVALLGGGASLTQADVDRLRGRCHVIAINDAFLLAPWADCLWFTDARWIDGEKANERWKGPGNRAEVDASPIPLKATRAEVQGFLRLHHERTAALALQPNAVAGSSGGANAMNLAYHLGPRRQLLLGFDMRPGHWHDRHKVPSKVANYTTRFPDEMARMGAALVARGVGVVNCTPGSALTCFPMASLDEALP